jgi:hypothetical protein
MTFINVITFNKKIKVCEYEKQQKKITKPNISHIMKSSFL